MNSTNVAIPFICKYTHEKSAEFISQDVEGEREKYMERNRKFFVAFNKWLNVHRIATEDTKYANYGGNDNVF